MDFLLLFSIFSSVPSIPVEGSAQIISAIFGAETVMLSIVMSISLLAIRRAEEKYNISLMNLYIEKYFRPTFLTLSLIIVISGFLMLSSSFISVIAVILFFIVSLITVYFNFIQVSRFFDIRRVLDMKTTDKISCIEERENAEDFGWKLVELATGSDREIQWAVLREFEQQIDNLSQELEPRQIRLFYRESAIQVGEVGKRLAREPSTQDVGIKYISGLLQIGESYLKNIVGYGLVEKKETLYNINKVSEEGDKIIESIWTISGSIYNNYISSNKAATDLITLKAVLASAGNLIMILSNLEEDQISDRKRESLIKGGYDFVEKILNSLDELSLQEEEKITILREIEMQTEPGSDEKVKVSDETLDYIKELHKRTESKLEKIHFE